MRKFLPALLILLCVCNTAISQEKPPPPDPNPVVVSTYTYEPPAWNDTTFRNINLDSLVNFYMDKGIRPNPLYKNYRILVHRWGADSYKIMFIYEIDKIENLEKADPETVKLIDATFKNEADKKKFWKLWSLLFDRHDDSIMSDFTKPKF